MNVIKLAFKIIQYLKPIIEIIEELEKKRKMEALQEDHAKKD